MSNYCYTEYCKYFNIGNCNGHKNNKCKYKYHIKCNLNWLCDDKDCIYGHGFSIEKRHLVIDIVNINNKKEKCDQSPNKCAFPLGCERYECKLEHYLSSKERRFLREKIINKDVSNIEAIENFKARYHKNSISPKSDIISVTTTIPAMCSPCTICPVDTFQDTTDGTDNFTSAIDEIINNKKKLNYNRAKAEELKSKIIALTEQLKIYEEQLKIDKEELKLYENKIEINLNEINKNYTVVQK